MTTEHATQLRNHWWWRPGWRADRQFYTWHLTFTGQRDLHRLVTAYQHALRDVPGLDLIPVDWLHLTMQGVGFVDEIAPADIRAIADTATRHLAELPPAKVTFHRPVVRPEALALPPTPIETLFAIRDAIRAGIAAVWGDDHVPETNNRFQPHLSMAYVNTDGPATAAVAALNSVQPEPAHVTVTEASLIVLHRDDHLYHWDTFASGQFAAQS
ncbi:MAG TPA: 2'-5' RNA ligase family protein [Actinophytocola sp.]|uniref:2'-5' RNA ligase family protein n=1 Tax=Actinophytocola sp. TaxID=1872138 RepID=UPI002DDD33DC|nr:2'-5' RNA ligase family protein [Actinophytocola sp.]HEV2780369.1 2'-5' RNA ligase family protein [Actinophytocola sp.]